jgi:hypothetical protein
MDEISNLSVQQFILISQAISEPILNHRTEGNPLPSQGGSGQEIDPGLFGLEVIK